jgi:hypothetical protein
MPITRPDEDRPTGVARVHRGVGLDRVRDVEPVGRLDRAVEAGNDAGAEAALDVEWIADHGDRVADAVSRQAAERERSVRPAGSTLSTATSVAVSPPRTLAVFVTPFWNATVIESAPVTTRQ